MSALLVDSCVSSAVCAALTGRGHDVAWVGSWAEDPGDRAVLEAARRDGRVLITLDKDFGEFAVLEALPHSGIIRLVDLPLRDQAQRCHDALVDEEPLLARGGIVTVEPTRLRLREPE